MNLAALITDNVTEALIKIIEFTQSRQKVLILNVNNSQRKGFVPKDMPVDEFSKLMHEAIDEHAKNQRLLLRDSDNIKFGASGNFEAQAVLDEQALSILQNNRDEFLRLQIDKLLENSINQRIALEILKQKQGEELISLLDLN